MFKRPSPSLGISMLALLISLGGAAFSANGGSFILGQANSATAKTSLVAPVADSALRISNTSADPAAIGIRIQTASTQPPLGVNSSVKVANLNADLIDGINSANLATRQVINFDLAAGENSKEVPIPPGRAIHIAGELNSTVDVGQVTAFRIGGNIRYFGIQTFDCGVCFLAGTAGEEGATLLKLSNNVQVETGSDVTSVRVHNGSGGRRIGYVTLIW
jgi:hypothetical protein